VVAAGGLLFAALVLALGMPILPATATALFLSLGVVAGLTESGERSLVARLAPVRTGERFGVYHALTGLAALPGGLLFGALYQSASGPTALWVSAAGMVLAVMVWLSATAKSESALPPVDEAA
jgi:predicted MFS family arabinose efflux permease